MDAFIKVLSWAMLAASIVGFGKLLYDGRWIRAVVASILTGITLYMMIFF